MIKRLSVICLTVALASTAHAGLRIASSTALNSGAPTDGTATAADGALAPGTTTASFNVQYFNDNGAPAAFIGAQVLDFSLSVNAFAGSGVGVPTLVANTPAPGSGFSAFSAGFIGSSNLTGTLIAAGDAATIGILTVDIPADFLGQFTLVNDSDISVTVNDPALAGLAGAGAFNQSIAAGGITGTPLGQVGTAVPEPSSFLFLGLVGTGMIGFRRMRQRREDLEEEVA